MEENQNVVTTPTVEKEGSKFGWGVLGFFIPLVGLILFLVWMKDKKRASKAAGIGALIGVGVGLILSIILVALFGAALGIGLFGYVEDNDNPLTPVVEETCDDLEECYPDFSKMTESEIDAYSNNKKIIKNGKKEIYQKMYTTDCKGRKEGQIVSLIKVDGDKYTIPDGKKKNEEDEIYKLVCKDMSNFEKTELDKLTVSKSFEKYDYNYIPVERVYDSTKFLRGNDNEMDINIDGNNVNIELYSMGEKKESESFIDIKSVFYYENGGYYNAYLISNDNTFYVYTLRWDTGLVGTKDGNRAKKYSFNEEINSVFVVILGGTTSSVEYEAFVSTPNGKYLSLDGNKSLLDNDFAEYMDSNRYILTNKNYKVGNEEGKIKIYFKNTVVYGFESFIDDNNNYREVNLKYDKNTEETTILGTINRGKISNMYTEFTSNNTLYYVQVAGTDYYWQVLYGEPIY